MNEQRVDLPGGGTAWITTMPTHGQAKALRRHRLRMSRFVRQGTDGWRTDLTSEEQDQLDDLLLESSVLHVRTLTNRWEEVRAPNGDALSFPDDIERMPEAQLQALYDAITARDAGKDGADPNAESSTSASTSPPVSLRKTRPSQRR